MNPKERVKAILAGKETDRLLFCPAIYEHKAKLIAKSVSEVCQTTELLSRAVLTEYETYAPDMLTIGIDIYNIEAEALGGKVIFPETDYAVPVISERLMSDIDDLEKLGEIDPEKSGRMPVMLQAAEVVNNKLGSEVYLRGAISGPVSIAAELFGIENLLMAMLTQPNKVDSLLRICSEVVISYGKAFIERGLEVCIFDSQATPPLVSPLLYETLILPHIRKLIYELKEAGAEFIEYVVGGDTGPIAEHLFATGADIILSDFNSDVDLFLDLSKNRNILVRRNISPILIEQGPEQRLQTQINDVIKLAAEQKNVIIGTGVISYNTDVEKIQAVRKMSQGKHP